MKATSKYIWFVVAAVLAVVGGVVAWLLKKKKNNNETTTTAPAVDVFASLTNNAIGYKNNNPLNIRYSSRNNWIGQIGERSGFCVFDTPTNGIRAAMVNLKSYRKSGYVTIADIVSRWAPPTENDTANYIDFVCKKLQRNQSDEIAQTSADYIALLQAMCIMEIGCQPYPQSTWIAAASAASL